MDIFSDIAVKIIEEQEGIIGPMAIEEAKKVPGLHIDWQKQQHHVTFHGNKSDLIEKLVEQYREIFGQISIDACKDAVQALIGKLPADQVPRLLR